MRPGRFGAFLLGTGVVVGATAVVGLVVGFEPSRLPPALLDVAAYKLTFLAAAGLLAAGAIIRRRANRTRDVSPTAERLERGSPASRDRLSDRDVLSDSPLLPEAREADSVRPQPPAVRVTPPG